VQTYLIPEELGHKSLALPAWPFHFGITTTIKQQTAGLTRLSLSLSPEIRYKNARRLDRLPRKGH
jgi:hypothetical protein